MKISKSQIDRIAQLTGLKNSTVQDLLESGWMYTETLNQMPKWQQPGGEVSPGIAQLHKNYRHVVVSTKAEGDEVLRRLMELVRTYNEVSVADFFDLVGIRSTFRENQWGWKSMVGAKVKKVDDGWELKLPEPEHL